MNEAVLSGLFPDNPGDWQRVHLIASCAKCTCLVENDMSQFVEVTRQGFGSRAKGSIGGVFFGFILVAGTVALLFWGEGRAVKRYKALKEGAGAVVEVSSAKVDPTMEGKLVHISGDAKTSGPISDAEFGVSEDAIKLQRTVEMYQWVENVKSETKNKVGGGTETVKTYSYSKEWRGSLVDSSSFKDPSAPQNPKTMPFESASFLANGVTVGAFSLPKFLISKISGTEILPIASLDNASAAVKEKAKVSNGSVYIGNDPNVPNLGDVRITFGIIRPGPVSVVAQQKGNSFVSYQAKTGNVDLLSRGIVPAAEMFQAAQEANKVMTWGIRIVGFVLLLVGFGLILKPISVFASVLPFLGKIAAAGTGIIGFLLAGIVWTVTVAFAWIFYRPILGIGILVVTVGLVVLAIIKLRKAPEVPTMPASTPPPMDDAPPPLA